MTTGAHPQSRPATGRGSTLVRVKWAWGWTAAKIAAATILCFLPPIVAHRMLHASGGMVYPLLYCALVEGLFVYRLLTRARAPETQLKRIAATATRVLLGLLLGGCAVVILVGLNITPASAYLAWFALVRRTLGTGTLSYMFTVDYAYFGSLFAGLFLVGDPAFALFGYLFVGLFLTSVILGTPLLEALTIVVLLGAVGYKVALWVGRRPKRAVRTGLLLIVVLLLVALPLSVKPGKNPVFDLVYKYPLNSLVASIFPNFPFLYNVPGYGYSLNSGQLGAPPALTATPVFEIRGAPGETIYLRTAAYDTYTGNRWIVSGLTQRLSSLNGALIEQTHGSVLPVASTRAEQSRSFPYARLEDWPSYPAAFEPWGRDQPSQEFLPGAQRYFRQTLSRGIPAQPSPLPPPRPITEMGVPEPPLTVTVLTDFFGALPHTLHTVGFQFPGAARPALQYGSLDTGFLVSVPLVRGNRVILDRRARDSSLAQPSATNPDPLFRLTALERLTDLQIGMVTPEVRQLARSLKRATTEQTLAAIRSYLTENYIYSLDTRAPKPTESLIDEFLFHSRKGYCVQFASAFVVLARLDEIPARYVTGFLAYLPPKEHKVVVTGLEAHAWAEVWDNRWGWTIEEATPPMLQSSISDPSYYTHFNPTDSPATLRELRAIMGARVALPTAPPGQSVAGRFEMGRPILVALAAVPAAVALSAFAWLLVGALQPEETRIRRIVRTLARRAPRAHLPDPSRSGWQAWGEHAAARNPRHSQESLRVAELILRLSFSGRAIERSDSAFLRRYCRTVARRASLLRRRGTPADAFRAGKPVSRPPTRS